MTQREIAYNVIVGQEENARHQHFSPFCAVVSTCLMVSSIICATVDLSSANAWNLVECKVL